MSCTTIRRYFASGTITSSCFFVRKRSNFNSSYNNNEDEQHCQHGSTTLDFSTIGRINRTSLSSSCTRPPEAFTQPHTLAAKSSRPGESPPFVCWAASFENDPPADGFVKAAAEEPRVESWPFVRRMAPVARSRTTVALTPGFLERRFSFSSSASCPLVYAIGALV